MIYIYIYIYTCIYIYYLITYTSLNTAIKHSYIGVFMRYTGICLLVYDMHVYIEVYQYQYQYVGVMPIGYRPIVITYVYSPTYVITFYK